MDQLGNTLGSAYKELQPLQREAIEARAEQLRHLVRSRDPDHVLEAGRQRQRAYMKENALQASRARERASRYAPIGGSEWGDYRGHLLPFRTGAASEGCNPRSDGAGFLALLA